MRVLDSALSDWTLDIKEAVAVYSINNLNFQWYMPVILAVVALLGIFFVSTFAFHKDLKMGAKQSNVKTAAGAVASSIFDFEVLGKDGGPLAMNSFRGKKAYLVVNVASK